MNVLVWFKRDLRIHDHPALDFAAGLGAVLPVHVVEPELWAQPDLSARQWEFLAESLADLREALAGIGAPLVVRVGDAVEVLNGLCRRHDISQIVSHEETGNLWTYARDRRVAGWARAAGVTWTELPQTGVVRRKLNVVARGDGFMSGPVLPAPVLCAVAGVEPGLIPSARALKLAPDPCPHRQLGGRARGLELVDTFLNLRGEQYRMATSSPLSAERASSRLSPHLAMGTLSAREVMQTVVARQAERPGGGWGASLSSFQSRLAWRDQSIQQLEDTPGIERQHPFAAVRARDSDPAWLAAWAAGETGLPYLDACLRYLRATGWLSAPMRSMAISVALHHLCLDWRSAGRQLARMLTDYEPGIHWPQVQLQAGMTGMHRPRICSPVKLGHDQDPTGAFTRRWLPELGAVPDAVLQEPWLWPEARRVLGHRYPEPIIDLATAAREARDRIWQARRSAGFAETASMLAPQDSDRASAVLDKSRLSRLKLPNGQLSLPF